MKDQDFLPRYSLIMVLILSLFCQGCFHRVPGFQPHGQVLTEAERAALFTKIENLPPVVRSFRAMSSSRLIHAKERQAFRQILLFELPDRLRLESLALNAAYTLNLLVVDHSDLTFIDTSAKSAVVGIANRESMASVINIPLEVSDLISLLSGRISPHFLKSENGNTVYLSVSDDATRYFVWDLAQKIRYEVDADTALLRGVEIYDRFSNRLQMVVQDMVFKQVGTKIVPQQLTFSYPRYDLSLGLKFGTVETDISIRPELFRAVIPGDFDKRILNQVK